MAYATDLGSKKFYIHGGSTSSLDAPSNQFAILDINSLNPWNISNPSWKIIYNSGGPAAAGHSLVVSPIPYQTNLTLITKKSVSTYHLENEIWTDPWPQNLVTYGIKSMGDPVSGLIFTPACADDRKSMCVYERADNTRRSVPMHPGAEEIQGYSLAWNGQMGAASSLLLYGGQIGFGGPYYQQLLLFNIREERWSAITTTGEQPGAMKNACMAPAYDGAKIILFGGEPETGSNRGDIFILDVRNWVWKKGPAAGLDQARFAMACTAIATSFIAFGGDNMNNSPFFQDMIIFNMHYEVWTNMFLEGKEQPPPPSPATRYFEPSQPTQSRWPALTSLPDPTEDPKPSNRFNVAIIAGSAGAAGVVILVSIILFIICRRNKSRRRNASNGKSARDIYPDKNYRGAELTRPREWVDGRPDRQRHTNQAMHTNQAIHKNQAMPTNQIIHMSQATPTNQATTNLSPKAVRRAPRNDTSPYSHHPSFPLPPLSPPSTVYSAGSPTLVSSPSSTNSQSHYKKSTLEPPPLNDNEPHKAKMHRPQGYMSAQAPRGQQHPRNPQRQSVMTPLQQTWEYQQQQSRNPQCGSSSQDQEEEEEDNIPPSLADKPYSIQRNSPSTLSPLPETWEFQRGQQNPQYLPTPSPWTQSIVQYPSPTSPWNP
ncbi:hypothetical protein BG011_006745 [Mortierella polycephala]|uniref:Galactose oxidase n=1 Tax=Mortierella polycephala TaxID=41804 RepID=A0A9P6TZ48_9FUNG|nr:hypothetical protein BG011_006745 [Mortierella polycephala]